MIYETIEDLQGVMISKEKAVKIIKQHSAMDELNDFWFKHGINDKYDAFDVYAWLGY